MERRSIDAIVAELEEAGHHPGPKNAEGHPTLNLGFGMSTQQILGVFAFRLERMHSKCAKEGDSFNLLLNTRLTLYLTTIM